MLSQRSQNKKKKKKKEARTHKSTILFIWSLGIGKTNQKKTVVASGEKSGWKGLERNLG